jgi:hypothetical protein
MYYGSLNYMPLHAHWRQYIMMPIQVAYHVMKLRLEHQQSGDCIGTQNTQNTNMSRLRVRTRILRIPNGWCVFFCVLVLSKVRIFLSKVRTQAG